MMVIYPAYMRRRKTDSNNVIRPSDKHYNNILLLCFSTLTYILTMIKIKIDRA